MAESTEQFLLFPQCFQKACTANTLKPELVLVRAKAKVLDLARVKAFADNKITETL